MHNSHRIYKPNKNIYYYADGHHFIFIVENFLTYIEIQTDFEEFSTLFILSTILFVFLCKINFHEKLRKCELHFRTIMFKIDINMIFIKL